MYWGKNTNSYFYKERWLLQKYLLSPTTHALPLTPLVLQAVNKLPAHVSGIRLQSDPKVYSGIGAGCGRVHCHVCFTLIVMKCQGMAFLYLIQLFIFQRNITECIPTVFMNQVTSQKFTCVVHPYSMGLGVPMAVAGAEEVSSYLNVHPQNWVGVKCHSSIAVSWNMMLYNLVQLLTFWRTLSPWRSRQCIPLWRIRYIPSHPRSQEVNFCYSTSASMKQHQDTLFPAVALTSVQAFLSMSASFYIVWLLQGLPCLSCLWGFSLWQRNPSSGYVWSTSVYALWFALPLVSVVHPCTVLRYV